MTSTLDQPQHNVSFEHQRQLAKLLAKENIRVRQGNYKTAFFDVKNRVLGLPTWNLEDKSVSDLLVGHEVGHAHWTPEDGITRYHDRFGKEAPFDIANVVEDIRIERKILAAFPGLVSSFTKGYTYLRENDFFKLKDRKIEDLNFLDRLNLKGKLRHLIEVEFDEWETDIYNRCLKADTYEEVLDICGEIIDNLPKQKPEEQPPSNDAPSAEDSDEDDGDDLDIDIRGNDADPSMNENDGDKSDSISDQNEVNDEDQTDGSNQTTTSSEESEEGGENTSAGKEAGDDYDYSDAISETQRALDAELENSQKDFGNDVYVDAPNREQIKKCIYSIDKVRAARKEKLSFYNSLMTDPNEDLHWTTFKKTSKKNVALLVREFERKKSAYEYSRAQTSATGSIDPNKLHSYKYDDQIFKSVTKLATSKDHGMIFFVDWSGSMNMVLHQVVQQTLQLAFFCKAVGIPFSVYGFTTGRRWRNEELIPRGHIGDVVDLSGTSVFELLNSSISKREFEDAAKELFLGSRSFGNSFGSDIESLGGTPLYNTILCAEEIVREFRAQHNVQKLHTMFLTDGESQCLSYSEDKKNKELENQSENGRSTDYWSRKEYLRWGNTLIGPDAFRHGGRQITYRQLILNFKKVTGSSAICFFLGAPRDAKSAAINAIIHSSKFKATSWYDATEEYKILRKKSIKDKSRTVFVEDGLGYDGYFIIESSKMKIVEDNDLETEGGIDLSKATEVNRLARKFSTLNREKRTSRVFLSKFSDLIA